MLQDASRSGNINEVASLLSGNMYTQNDLANALAIASFNGYADIVSLLIDKGACPNSVPSHHMPPIFCAVEQRRLDVINILSSKGADLNIQLDNGFTPLHLAVDIEGDMAWQRECLPVAEVTKLLLELGANPNIADADNRKPIDIAYEYKHDDAILLLSKYHAM